MIETYYNWYHNHKIAQKRHDNRFNYREKYKQFTQFKKII